MSLHHTPEDHDADPPAKWLVVKDAERSWHLDSSLGGTFGYYKTRKAAEADRLSGFSVGLYEREGRWFAGQTPAGWRPYSVIVAERERRAARELARAER